MEGGEGGGGREGVGGRGRGWEGGGGGDGGATLISTQPFPLITLYCPSLYYPFAHTPQSHGHKP